MTLKEAKAICANHKLNLEEFCAQHGVSLEAEKPAPTELDAFIPPPEPGFQGPVIEVTPREPAVFTVAPEVKKKGKKK